MTNAPPLGARDRLIAAAFELFDVEGFDGATVDDIARHAGLGRTTFFRHFGSKEAVIFPDHDFLLQRIKARLDAGDASAREVAIAEAARLVLRYYVDEGERARIRYRLVSSVPALRAREIASIRQYQSLFTRALSGWMAEDPDALLRAELVASAVVTAHNHVLRRWLRGETDAPENDFTHAMSLALTTSEDHSDATAVVIFRSGMSLESVTSAVRRALEVNG